MSNAGPSIRRLATYQQYSVSLVVLSDTARQSALPLQEALVRESIKRGLRVVAVCTERLFSADIMDSPSTASIDWRPLTTTLPTPRAAALTANFSGLAQEIERCVNSKREETLLAARSESQARVCGKDVLVVFDSLECLLQTSVAGTLGLLRDVRRKLDLATKSRIMARFPRDVFTQSTKVSVPADSPCYIASCLCELADAVVDVHPLSSLDTWMPGWYSNDQRLPFLSLRDCDSRRGVLCLEHKRQSGKVCFEVASFEIGDQLLPEFSLVTTNSSASSSSALGGSPSEARSGGGTSEPALAARPLQQSALQAPDPTANLPFNLSLTDKQRRDKAEVALPYLEARVADVAGGSGDIIYQLDEEDDWDEDDPDDDLDI
ncbi:Elongator complex protein [Coemansia sp. BCRC 34301]|nr:Elongator complex protein [Coemansia sp. BCRC 34301]